MLAEFGSASNDGRIEKGGGTATDVGSARFVAESNPLLKITLFKPHH